jgi:hypothetical protein
MYWLIIGQLRRSIASAYQTNYLSGYPNLSFKPRQLMPPVKALTALASGLGYGVKGDASATLKNIILTLGKFLVMLCYAMNVMAAAT